MLCFRRRNATGKNKNKSKRVGDYQHLIKTNILDNVNGKVNNKIMALICHHINKRMRNAKTRVTTAKARDRLFMEKHFLCNRCSNILNSSHNSFFEMPCVFPVCAGLEIYWLFLIRFLYFKGKVLPAKQYLKIISRVWYIANLQKLQIFQLLQKHLQKWKIMCKYLLLKLTSKSRWKITFIFTFWTFLGKKVIEYFDF